MTRKDKHTDHGLIFRNHGCCRNNLGQEATATAEAKKANMTAEKEAAEKKVGRLTS